MTYGEYRIGGTRLSSPLFAGIDGAGRPGRRPPHGFANPLFYASAETGAFRDVKPDGVKRGVVRNDYANGGSAGRDQHHAAVARLQASIFTRPGYDDVTGVGSPNGAAFLAGLR